MVSVWIELSVLFLSNVIFCIISKNSFFWLPKNEKRCFMTVQRRQLEKSQSKKNASLGVRGFSVAGRQGRKIDQAKSGQEIVAEAMVRPGDVQGEHESDRGSPTLGLGDPAHRGLQLADVRTGLGLALQDATLTCGECMAPHFPMQLDDKKGTAK